MGETIMSYSQFIRNKLIAGESLIPTTVGGDVTEYTGPIASRSALPDLYATNNATKYMKNTTVHEFYDGGNKIQLVFSTVYGSGTNETGLGTGTYSVASFVTIRGTSYQITYSGALRGTANYSDHLISDLVTLPVSFKVGEKFTVTSYCIFNPTGAFYPYYSDGLNWQFASSGERCQTSSTALTELTLGEVVTNNAYQNIIYRPFAILGKTSKHTAFIAGDSKQRGGGGNNLNVLTDSRGINGECARALDARRIAYINCGTSGDDYFSATGANKYTKRAQMAQYCTFIVDGYGINDIGVGSTVSYTCSSSATTTVSGIVTANMVAGMVGQVITGNNIYPDTTITAVNSTSSITISKTPAAAITSFTLVNPNLSVSGYSTYITALRTALGALNKTYIKATMTPRALATPFAGSKDIYRFISNQATALSEPVRRLINKAIRRGSLPIDDYVDGCPAVEVGTDTGLQIFGESARIVTDGSINASSNLFTSVSAAFSIADDKKMITILGIGAGTAHTCTSTSTATVIGISPTTTNLFAGQPVSGTNIAAGTTILSVDSTTAITLSQAPTGAITAFTALASVNAEMNYMGGNVVALTFRGTVDSVTATTSQTNAKAYIRHLDYTRDGLHYTGLGEEKIAKDGNFTALNKFI
jgi:hypothetical protein